jgi:hypothetical protein
MRNLIFVLGLILAVFLNACQENSITDPITDNNIEKNSSYYANLNSGKIKLDEELTDPSQSPGAPYNIFGTIEYGISHIGSQISAEQYYNTIVKMKIDAILKPSALIDKSSNYPSSYLAIQKTSEDFLNISMTGAREFKLSKKYKVTGSNNHLNLVCTFAVTPNSLILKEMHLCCVRQVVNLETD